MTHPCLENAFLDGLLQRRQVCQQLLERLCLCGAVLLGQVAEVDDDIGVRDGGEDGRLRDIRQLRRAGAEGWRGRRGAKSWRPKACCGCACAARLRLCCALAHGGVAEQRKEGRWRERGPNQVDEGKEKGKEKN